jgi:hypothetical protein
VYTAVFYEVVGNCESDWLTNHVGSRWNYSAGAQTAYCCISCKVGLLRLYHGFEMQIHTIACLNLNCCLNNLGQRELEQPHIHSVGSHQTFPSEKNKLDLDVASSGRDTVSSSSGRAVVASCDRFVEASSGQFVKSSCRSVVCCCAFVFSCCSVVRYSCCQNVWSSCGFVVGSSCRLVVVWSFRSVVVPSCRRFVLLSTRCGSCRRFVVSSSRRIVVSSLRHVAVSQQTRFNAAARVT